jgi:quercetin dioxygenase-like cupin family protein
VPNIFGTAKGAQQRPPFVARADDTDGWEPSDVAGFPLKTLFHDPVTGDQTILMKVEPGAYAAPHSHDQVEHVYILEGSFSDEYGTYHAGDYLVRTPGSDHSTQSEQGATVLLMYTRP